MAVRSESPRLDKNMQVKLFAGILFLFVAQTLATPTPQGGPEVIRCHSATDCKKIQILPRRTRSLIIDSIQVLPLLIAVGPITQYLVASAALLVSFASADTSHSISDMLGAGF
ncbi:hypothetical protein M413DRAFT_30178 [Hebeloma cylindrosporum]|uniref:Uncharacterized protein n=1 Tax=Hebeloma cylindrosporum TaxID=76867 RepID=A0A0C3C225_HEBCY|nr:hypothetical protein M413DRAFT_30178 [Hebeloma cylindrosporum h7]